MGKISLEKRIDILREIDVLLSKSYCEDDSWVFCECEVCSGLRSLGSQLLNILPDNPKKRVIKQKKIPLELYLKERPNYKNDTKFALSFGYNPQNLSKWKNRNRKVLEENGYKFIEGRGKKKKIDNFGED